MDFRRGWTVLGRTYVDILGQELVRDFVLVDHVVVECGARSGRSEKEAEDTMIRQQLSEQLCVCAIAL